MRANAVDILHSIKNHRRSNGPTLVVRLKRVLQSVLATRYKSSFDIAGYESRVTDVPHQAEDNSFESGIFAMKYMRHWIGHLNTTSIFAAHVQQYRVELEAEIVCHPQNTLCNMVVKRAQIPISMFWVTSIGCWIV